MGRKTNTTKCSAWSMRYATSHCPSNLASCSNAFACAPIFCVRHVILAVQRHIPIHHHLFDFDVVVWSFGCKQKNSKLAHGERRTAHSHIRSDFVAKFCQRSKFEFHLVVQLQARSSSYAWCRFDERNQVCILQPRSYFRTTIGSRNWPRIFRVSSIVATLSAASFLITSAVAAANESIYMFGARSLPSHIRCNLWESINLKITVRNSITRMDWTHGAHLR